MSNAVKMLEDGPRAKKKKIRRSVLKFRLDCAKMKLHRVMDENRRLQARVKALQQSAQRKAVSFSRQEKRCFGPGGRKGLHRVGTGNKKT